MSDGRTDRIFGVLFPRHGKSARSILAESIQNKGGDGRFRAFSAGSQPKGVVSPLGLKVPRSFDDPVERVRSKSWRQLSGADAAVMDVVGTVCDAAAGEACVVLPGRPIAAQWGIEDPSAVGGPDIRKEAASLAASRCLRNRISGFTSLPVASPDQASLSTMPTGIGRSGGASSPCSTAT